MAFKMSFGITDSTFKTEFQSKPQEDCIDIILQNKEATPSEIKQEITADEGYTALAKVIINPIPNEYIIPSGTKKIKDNGNHDVKHYEAVDVDVPIPDGYIIPSGKLSVYENGEYDVTPYASVSVNVEANEDYSLEEYFTGYMSELNLPNIESIGDKACYMNPSIKTLNMPNVKTVGTQSFYQSSLIEVNAPNLTEIQDRGFSGCASLTNISFPNIKHLRQYAFYKCTKLVLTSLPSTLLSIRYNAFANCLGLKTITFNSTPRSIDHTAFIDCTNLTTINVPWSEGEVSGAPWGATNATINYNYTGE